MTSEAFAPTVDPLAEAYGNEDPTNGLVPPSKVLLTRNGHLQSTHDGLHRRYSTRTAGTEAGRFKGDGRATAAGTVGGRFKGSEASQSWC